MNGKLSLNKDIHMGDRKEAEGLSALGSASQFGRYQCISEFKEERGGGNRGHQRQMAGWKG